MVGTGVIFRFSADIRDLTAKIDIMSKKLDQLGIKSRSATASLGQVGGAATATGQAATTSAIGIGVMTQGMLNLTTALVQTITSLSNLERVQNRAKASAIAVARAQDLLANKEERLASLRKSGVASQQKIVNIMKEISTATADITVKTEKLGIEQRAITDIYALFFTNLANVGISTFQTAASLMQIMAARSLGASAAMIQNTAATGANTVAVQANTGSRRLFTPVILGNVIAQKIGILTTKAGTLAIRIQIGALTALKIALGPIGLLLIGISAAMAIYEVATGGISKAMGFAEAGAKSFEEQLIADRVATDELAQSMGGLSDDLTFTMPKSLGEAILALRAYQRELVAAKKAQISFNEVVFQPLNIGNFTLPVGGVQTNQTGFRSPASGLKIPNLQGRASFLRSIPLFLKGSQALIRHKAKPDDVNKLVAELARDPESGSLTALVIENSKRVQEAEKGIEFMAALVSDQDTRIRFLITLPRIEKALREPFIKPAKLRFDPSRFDPAFGRFLIPEPTFGLTQEEFDKRIRQSAVGKHIRQFGTIFPKGFGPEGEGIIDGIAADRETEKKLFQLSLIRGNRARGITRSLGDRLGIIGQFTPKQELAFRVRMLQVVSPELKRKVRSGEITGNRLDVLSMTGTDIGNVAQVIPFNEAMRLASLQRDLADTVGFFGGQVPEGGFVLQNGQFTTPGGSLLNAQTIERNNAISKLLAANAVGFNQKAFFNDAKSNFAAAGGNVGNTNFFGAGFFNSKGATAAAQVSNVGTPMHILQRIAAQDAWAKSIDSILGQAFQGLLYNGNPGVRLNRSQANTLKARDRGVPGRTLDYLLAPLKPILAALATITSSGISMLTLDEARLYGNIGAITTFIGTVGKPRYDFELDRLRQHDADVERFNERLVAMSSGVGGF